MPMKELPATVPERRRGPDGGPASTGRDPAPSAGTIGAAARPPGASPDSYQPDPAHGTIVMAPPSHHEQIVPTGASVESILAEIRKAPRDRLDVESRVAQGGMGTIDAAVDRALDRRIALKTLHRHLRGDDATVRMFLREARLTGLLEHPHIVPVYDIAETEDRQLYFAMKLVEGRTLADVIRALPRGPIDTATLYELLDVFAKVCDALAFAHSRGVLHCDIKPANVMVGEFGQVYLTDWGIARLVASEAAPGSVPDLREAAAATNPAAPGGTAASPTDNSVIGTPCYMSPEQARGDRARLDARSDVFLMGALLYEVLTRRPPYAAQDRIETLSLAAACAFPAPRKVAGDGAIPPELERIVLRAMAKDPASRYPHVRALKDDLVQFLRGGAEFPRRTFGPGEAIVREGEPGDAAYIIVSGRCEVRQQIGGAAHVVRELGAGAVFGEMAILSAGPRTATVAAVEPTTVLVVTQAALEQEMAALKPWMATLLKSVASKFRDVDTRNRTTSMGLSSSTSPSPARLANQVLMHVMTWGEDDAAGGRSMRWSTLANELEAQLGMTPFMIFGAMTRYGIVLDADGDRLTIPDPAALRARLAGDLRGA
jgi:serine/threonine-protein kinase